MNARNRPAVLERMAAAVQCRLDAQPELIERFGSLSSWSLWAWLLREGLDSVPELQELLPVPPPELMARVVGSDDPLLFHDSGLSDAFELLEALRSGGFEEASQSRLLDFGCGCGRLLRVLARLAFDLELHGADVDAQAIDWDRENLKFAQFALLGEDPPNSCTGWAAVQTVFNTVEYFAFANAFSSNVVGNYPNTPFGLAMKRIAQAIKENLVMEVYETDLGGWDLHASMGVGNGAMHALLRELGLALRAFDNDMVNAGCQDNVLVIVQTEFGRRVNENASLGSDHGWGGCMMLMGPSGLRGGLVHTRRWQRNNLVNQLWNGEDLPAFIDYRDVLWDALQGHLGLSNTELSSVFPNYVENPLNVFN